jgi:DNA (cytosine-5)-methyltransferase 1
MRWHHDLRPEWIAMEEVPDVLPLWQQYAQILRGWGYSAWCGILNAADYGVPQTRRRAILIASRVRDVAPPEPTHAQEAAEPGLFGEGRTKWVSMAEALSWTTPTVVNTRGDRVTPGGNEFPADGPSWSLTGKARSWVLRNDNQPGAAVRGTEEPAPTMAFGNNAARVEWVRDRPSTTVCATDRVSPPGHRDRSPGGESQFASPDTVRITIAEAAVLQSFPADYPWQGSKTKQFEQVGNAVPPLLAAHVVSAATGIPLHARTPALAVSR